MLKNFFRAALRNLQKNKTYSFLNLFGLTIGLACAGLIFLWVEDELHFDNNNLRKDRLCLVKVNAKEDAGIFTHSSTPGPLGPAMQAGIPGIARTCRVTEDLTSILFGIGDKTVFASGKYAEPSLFDLFTLPFVQGNAQNAFSQLYSLVITEKTAKKFFGSVSSVIGKTVRVDNKQDYVVTGVLRDLPENASLQFEWLAPFQIFYQQNTYLEKWDNFGLTTYVLLKPGVDPVSLNKQFLDPLYDFTIQKKDATASTDHIFLFPMNQWRLYDQFDNGKETGSGRIVFVHLFSIIAWIILFIACINFMNLATARSEKRSREVGVRKVLGAAKSSIAGQFIGEAVFLSLLAMALAILMMSLALAPFNQLVQKNLSLGLDNPIHWVALLSATLLSGLVAGSYPSFYLSSFNPAKVLKGMKVKTGSAAFIRKGLVVLQFTVSIILVIATVTIYRQIQHVKNRNLGFNKNHLIEMTLQGDMLKNFSSIRQEFINTGSVENAALADHSPLADGNNTSGISWPGKSPGSQIVISQRLVSPEFMSTLGMHIKEGRDFVPTDMIEMASNGKLKDSNQVFQVIVTASMAQLLGKGSALGKTMQFNSNLGILHLLVAGVVSDYVYGDMYGKQAAPVIFYCFPQATSLLYVRTQAQSSPGQALAKMENILKKKNPGYPFAYSFVDDQFNALFLSETLISKLSRVFAALAIMISCLGLFGLAAYTAERRTREIGIRKVLGASVTGITTLLSRDFLQLIALAAVFAFPIAWWVMNNWLQAYTYRISIGWWVFPMAGLFATAIALITISFQSIRAAIANPVKSLRME
jgi:putative ABC transport system permease protein